MAVPLTDEALQTRQRSAALREDTKFKEMSYFVTSHRHLGRVVGNKAGRATVCEAELNVHVDEHVQCRIEWREMMDRNVKRLLLDTELDLGEHPQVPDPDSCSLRCKHLDQSFEWFEKYGAKEVKKEREAQSYMTFEDHDPVLPGSLRRPLEWGELPPRLRPKSEKARRPWLTPELANMYKKVGIGGGLAGTRGCHH